MDIAEYLFKNFHVIFKNGVDKIILTIDDAPYSDESFCDILNVLDKFNNKATFFVISSYVNENNKQLLIKAIRNGHHLGNHGKHNTMHALYNYEHLSDELETCQQLIDELYLEANIEKPIVKYFRPGVGIVTSACNQYCLDHNYKIFLGSNYCSDPKIKNSWINEKYIMNHLKSNDIIIIHDRKWTATMLDSLFNQIPKTYSLMDYRSSN